MQNYGEIVENVGIKYSSSMYDRIKSWILNGNDDIDPEEYRGNLVNYKVNHHWPLRILSIFQLNFHFF